MGILAAQCAFVRGAARVVLIDQEQDRLDFATARLPKLETINFQQKKVLPGGGYSLCRRVWCVSYLCTAGVHVSLQQAWYACPLVYEKGSSHVGLWSSGSLHAAKTKNTEAAPNIRNIACVVTVRAARRCRTR